MITDKGVLGTNSTDQLEEIQEKMMELMEKDARTRRNSSGPQMGAMEATGAMNTDRLEEMQFQAGAETGIEGDVVYPPKPIPEKEFRDNSPGFDPNWIKYLEAKEDSLSEASNKKKEDDFLRMLRGRESKKI